MYYLSCAFACENKTVDVDVLTIHDSTFFQCRHMKGLLLTVLFRLLFSVSSVRNDDACKIDFKSCATRRGQAPETPAPPPNFKVGFRGRYLIIFCVPCWEQGPNIEIGGQGVGAGVKM